MFYFGTNFNIFQDFVFKRFKQEQQCLWNYRPLNFFREETGGKSQWNVFVRLFDSALSFRFVHPREVVKVDSRINIAV